MNTTALNSPNEFVHAAVLLIYVYADTHKYAYGNLKYFIETAVHEQDGVNYFFILQQVENREVDETQLPRLPKGNAHYIQHENKCYDYGSIGWFFDKYTFNNPWRNEASITNTNLRFDLARYKYFIFMNSSIRGPFLPPYYLEFLADSQRELKKSFYWYHIFTKRIDNKVKLVGCTISCVPTVHVQSYFLTTDFTGLSMFLKTEGGGGASSTGIFSCQSAKADAISLSEMGISARILQTGYMIDCLLTKYQTIDFSRKANYRSSVYGNPYSDKNMDGVSLDPYEVVFVKFNDIKSTTDAQERAKLYQRWMEDVQRKNRSSSL